MVEYDSDDERKYEKEAVPDPTQDDYYHDAVDDFHAQKDKILLDKGLSLMTNIHQRVMKRCLVWG